MTALRHVISVNVHHDIFRYRTGGIAALNVQNGSIVAVNLRPQTDALFALEGRWGDVAGLDEVARLMREVADLERF